MATSAARDGSAERGLALIWMTCAADFTEHAVTDGAFAAGRTVGRGTFVTLCGTRVAPASMLTVPLSRCAGCTEVLWVQKGLSTGEHRVDGEARERGRGRWARAVRRWFRS